MSEPAATSLTTILDAAAAELENARRNPTPDGVEWSTGAVVFAAVGADGADFRLAQPVVEAALRTPATTRSNRGRDWVSFRPDELDQHAIDRATAWLASAWRRADGEA